MMQRFFCVLFILFAQHCLGTILIIDYGSPITHYIQYFIQRVHVDCVVRSYTISEDEIVALHPEGVLLSGGPQAVYKPNSPRVPSIVFDLEIPILGFCYGQQLLAIEFGGSVKHMEHSERLATELTVIDTCLLIEGIWQKGDVIDVWMGHEDHIRDMPKGFKTIASTQKSPHAFIADDTRKYYGLQFHPESPKLSWPVIIERFVLHIVGAQQDPTIVVEPLKVNEQAALRKWLSGCCGWSTFD
jgi:GMP synthase (glutamine-hydrolysing)